MEIIIFTIIGILSRMYSHVFLPNATAVGAISLFAGARFGLKKAFVILLSTMLLSDVFLGFHPTMWATYGSLFVTVLLGNHFLKKSGVVRIFTITLSSSVIFFILTNFAVWVLPNGMYPKTVAGLLDCFVMGLPFFRNTLMGDVIFSAVFFGGYAFVQSMQSCLAFRR
jgi:hypothetical protein